MAELNVFGYRHGHSLLHRLDVRSKLICLFLLTSSVVAASPAAMGPLTLLAVVLWGGLHLPLRLLGREMRLFLIFLLVVFTVRALVTPGTLLFAWHGLQVSREGLQAGAAVVWRLLVILVLGMVFVTTTRPSHLKAATQWLLRPVPFVSGRKAATMVGLMVRFIPVLHQQVRETQSALAARGGGAGVSSRGGSVTSCCPPCGGSSWRRTSFPWPCWPAATKKSAPIPSCVSRPPTPWPSWRWGRL